MNIGVIGCGNVGGTFALALAKKGYWVFGCDLSAACLLDLQKKADENAKIFPFAVPLNTTQFVETLVNECDVVFECVPTESDKDGRCDLSILKDIIQKIVDVARKQRIRTTVFVQRSTCTPGTADEMESMFEGLKINYVVNPSFLVMHSKEHDAEYPEKIVVGTKSEYSRDVMDFLYRKFVHPKDGERILYKSFEGVDAFLKVELAKYFENTLQAMLTSFWNQCHEIAVGVLPLKDESINFDIQEIIEFVGQTPDLATCIRVPGAAFGGACLPKDTLALSKMCDERGIPDPILQGILKMNSIMKECYGVRKESANELYRIDELTGKIIFK